MTPPPAVLARLEALEKMIRDATEGGCFIPPGEVLTWANELATLRASLAQQGEAVPQFCGVAIIADGTLRPNEVAFISGGKRTVFRLQPAATSEGESNGR